MYLALVKVLAADPPERQRASIESDLMILAVRLVDEYGMSAADVASLFDEAASAAYSVEVERGAV